MKRVRRILHPTDFSHASGPAFLKAIALANENRAELLLVHVMVPMTPFIGDGYVAPRTYEELAAAARRGAQRGLAKLLAKAKKAKARAKTVLLEGVPHAQIARVARARRAGDARPDRPVQVLPRKRGGARDCGGVLPCPYRPREVSWQKGGSP